MKNDSSSAYILVYVEYKNQIVFFERFIWALEKKGYELIFLTNKLSLKFFCFQKKLNCRLLWAYQGKQSDQNINSSIEILSRQISYNEGQLLFSSVTKIASEMLSKYRIKYVFFINGEKIVDLALKHFAKQNNIKMLFFELSNIPGKIFVDPLGTNANSLLNRNVKILEYFEAKKDEYEKWKNLYISDKLNNFVLPQAKMLRTINNPFLFLDGLGHFFLNIPRTNREKILKKILFKITMSIEKREKEKDITGEYYFLPTQVSTDSQLLIHSDFSNEKAILYAERLAKENNVLLVVKIHPAESNSEKIDKIFELSKKAGFLISEQNTTKLIMNAKKIITINSTIGLESLILNKDVLFLGKTFFSKLNEKYLKNYLLKYLVNVDFFGREKISLENVSEILYRCDIILN